jgi:hypothetical protein
MAPSGAMAIPTTLVWQVEVESASGTIKSGGATWGGGAGSSSNMWGSVPPFNPIVEFFGELQHNY